MAGRITQTFHGWDQPDVAVTLSADAEYPGEHDGLLRAWAADDETGEWWAMCQYSVATGVQLLGWMRQDRMPPVVELGDDDGKMATNVVDACGTRGDQPRSSLRCGRRP